MKKYCDVSNWVISFVDSYSLPPLKIVFEKREKIWILKELVGLNQENRMSFTNCKETADNLQNFFKRDLLKSIVSQGAGRAGKLFSNFDQSWKCF